VTLSLDCGEDEKERGEVPASPQEGEGGKKGMCAVSRNGEKEKKKRKNQYARGENTRKGPGIWKESRGGEKVGIVRSNVLERKGEKIDKRGGADCLAMKRLIKGGGEKKGGGWRRFNQRFRKGKGGEAMSKGRKNETWWRLPLARIRGEGREH